MSATIGFEERLVEWMGSGEKPILILSVWHKQIILPIK